MSLEQRLMQNLAQRWGPQPKRSSGRHRTSTKGNALNYALVVSGVLGVYTLGTLSATEPEVVTEEKVVTKTVVEYRDRVVEKRVPVPGPAELPASCVSVIEQLDRLQEINQEQNTLLSDLPRIASSMRIKIYQEDIQGLGQDAATVDRALSEVAELYVEYDKLDADVKEALSQCDEHK